MAKICLDPGHQKSEPGAVYKGLKEKDVTLAICLRTAGKLEEYGHEIKLTREINIDLGTSKIQELRERCRIANEFRADCFISVHCNADPDPDEPGMPEAKGEEIWYSEGSNMSKFLADCLAEKIDQIFPDEPFRGIKPTTGLYVLNHTEMPAVLIEVGFIDKSSSMETFTNLFTIDRIAQLIADGINEYCLCKGTAYAMVR